MLKAVNRNKQNTAQKCFRGCQPAMIRLECENYIDEVDRHLLSDLLFLSDSVIIEPLEFLHGHNANMYPFL